MWWQRHPHTLRIVQSRSCRCAGNGQIHAMLRVELGGGCEIIAQIGMFTQRILVIIVVAMVRHNHIVRCSVGPTVERVMAATKCIQVGIVCATNVRMVVMVHVVIIPVSHKWTGLGLSMKSDHIVIGRVLSEVRCHIEQCSKFGETKGQEEKVEGETVLIFVKGDQSLLVIGVR